MTYLQQRILASQIAQARKAIENVKSPFTIYPDVYLESAINTLNVCIDKLNNIESK